LTEKTKNNQPRQAKHATAQKNNNQPRHAKQATTQTKSITQSKMIYPVSDVLKTTSPTCVPEAPKDLALHTEPSSRTRRASLSFHGLSAAWRFQKW